MTQDVCLVRLVAAHLEVMMPSGGHSLIAVAAAAETPAQWLPSQGLLTQRCRSCCNEYATHIHMGGGPAPVVAITSTEDCIQ